MVIEKSSKRAVRRSQRERMFQRALNLEMNVRRSEYHQPGATFNGFEGKTYSCTIEGRREWAIDCARRTADNLRVCSCPACGNQRRYFGTEKIRDIRSFEREKSELEDYFQGVPQKLLDFPSNLLYNLI